MKAHPIPERQGTASHGNAFGRLLKDWRGRRGLSQLDLSIAAGTTQRHLSFIESGRAGPSRDMVLRLGATLSLPLRQQNALLLAAGFAPAWQERDLSAPDLAVVNNALDYMLAQHEPYPAFVIDRLWNLRRANRGALKLTEFLTGAADAAAPSEPVNLAVALLAPDQLRPFIVNWPEVARHFMRGVWADAYADGMSETADLLRRLLALPDVPGHSVLERVEDKREPVSGPDARPDKSFEQHDESKIGRPAPMPPEEGRNPVLPIHFRRDGISLRLFTAIATLGTPRDVTLEEIRIEFFFPMDEPTAQAFKSWAK